MKLFITTRVLFVIFSFVLLCGCNDAIGNQETPDPFYAASVQSIEGFLKKLQTGDADEALQSLLRQNPNIDIQDSSVIQLRKSFIEINQFSGRLVDAKMITSRVLSGRVAIFSYLASFEKRFYRFLFLYYNNGANVRIYKFKFDDSIDLELEESLRLFDKNEKI